MLGQVDPAKDADGLHPTNLGWLVLGIDGAAAMHARGIVELLRRHDVQIAGAEMVVVGRGVTVGRPLGLLLTRRSENATVTLCHTGTSDLAAMCAAPTSWSPPPAYPASSPATWSGRAPRCSTSVSVGSTASSPATTRPRCGGRRAGSRPSPAGSAR